MIGVDISDRSIKIARLNNKRRFLDATWSTIPSGIITGGVISNQPAVIEIIKKLLKSWHRLSSEAIVASVSGADSFLRVVSLPIIEAKDVGEAAVWEAAHHLPFDVDSIYADWQPVQSPAATGNMELLVGAAEKKKIDALWNVLAALGLDVAALELESLALVRALLIPGTEQTKGLLLVDVGGTNTNVVVYDCGTIRFTATLPHGLVSLVPEAAENPDAYLQTMANDKSTPPSSAMLETLSVLVGAVRGIVDYYNNLNPNHTVTEILLTGGGSLLSGLDQAFLAKFDNVHIQLGNPWVNILSHKQLTAPPLPPIESAHYATALGLALRPIDL